MDILGYIKEKYPHLIPIYEEIYLHGSRLYWEKLNKEMSSYAETVGLPYVRNDDSMQRVFDEPPVIVNFFYYEEIKKSAKKAK